MTDDLLNHLEVHYRHGREQRRLAVGQGLLERARTQHLLARRLPAPPAGVYDVGGAAGVYARWLADQGYAVRLFDVYPPHVEQASAEAGRGAPFAVTLADARELPAPDRSADAVLLLGPLYHLTARADRVAALTEARRVLRPGGFVAAAAISRYASLLDGVFRRFFEQPGYAEMVDRTLATGQHEPPPGADWFTRSYFHQPDELRGELAAAGFGEVDVLGVEGPGVWAADLAERHADPAAWRQVLDAAARTERDPATIGLSSHLLGFGTV